MSITSTCAVRTTYVTNLNDTVPLVPNENLRPQHFSKGPTERRWACWEVVLKWQLRRHATLNRPSEFTWSKERLLALLVLMKASEKCSAFVPRFADCLWHDARKHHGHIISHAGSQFDSSKMLSGWNWNAWSQRVMQQEKISKTVDGSSSGFHILFAPRGPVSLWGRLRRGHKEHKEHKEHKDLLQSKKKHHPGYWKANVIQLKCSKKDSARILTSSKYLRSCSSSGFVQKW